MNEPLPVPLAVAPSLKVSVQFPVAVTVPVISVVTPEQTDVLVEVIDAVGLSITETSEVVVAQPGSELLVNVKVADPWATPVTNPVLLTVATVVLLLVQLPSEFGVRLKTFPTQTEEADVITGNAVTFTVLFTVLVHPSPLVTV